MLPRAAAGATSSDSAVGQLAFRSEHFSTLALILLVLNVLVLVLIQYVVGVSSLQLVWIAAKLCWSNFKARQQRPPQKRKVVVPLPIDQVICRTHAKEAEAEGEGEPTVEATLRQML